MVIHMCWLVLVMVKNCETNETIEIYVHRLQAEIVQLMHVNHHKTV